MTEDTQTRQGILIQAFHEKFVGILTQWDQQLYM